MESQPQISDAQLLAQFSQMYRSAVEAYMDQAGMHRGQAMLLCLVSRQDGLTQSEIGEQLSVQGATITNMLQRIEAAGLIVRQRDPQDNRLVRVYATQAGKEKELAIRQHLSDLEGKILSGLSEADRARLRQLIYQIMANIEGLG